jgi:hypothetical protein
MKKTDKPMTRKEAKELSLEVWVYLAKHPDIMEKEQLPKYIFSKISNCECRCPLCEVFAFSLCIGCPLDKAGESCTDCHSLWTKWNSAREEDTRKQAAERIVQIISAWEPEETA